MTAVEDPGEVGDGLSTLTRLPLIERRMRTDRSAVKELAEFRRTLRATPDERAVG